MKRRAARAGLLLGGVTGLVAAGPASAAELQLDLHDCASLSQVTLREHLDMELATLQLAQVGASLSVRCLPGAVAIKLTLASGSRFPVEVRVDLRDTARGARERLIALAATELVAQAERVRGAEGTERRPSSAAPPRSLAEPVSSGDKDVVTAWRASRASELFVAGSLALDGAPKTTLWGGSLGAVLGLRRSWSVLLDTRFERGERQGELATVRWSSLSGFAGPSIRAELGVLRPAVGWGVRAGWLALSADAQPPHEGRSLTAPWVGLALPLRLGAELAAGVVPFLGVEAGYVLVPVRGRVDDGSSLAEHRGPWLAGNVGVAVRL